MKFYQTYFIDEYKFGKKGITFIVSDNYSELVSVAGGVQTDIINLENFKQDLNLSEAEFAVDELSFSVNGAAANKETDANCLAFLLEAKSSQRLVALYLGNYGSVLSSSNLLFLGKIDNKVTGDDLKWTGGNFATLINPIRVFKFSALSLDIALLEECVFSGDVYNESSVRVDNIYDRLKGADGEYTAITDLCDRYYILSNSYKNDVINYNLPHIIDLYQALNLYLTNASAMLEDLHGTSITFNLLDTDLPFKAAATNYEVHYLGAGINSIQKVIVETGSDSLYNLNLIASLPATKKVLYIDGRLLYANLDRPFWNETDTDTTLSEKANYQRNRFYSERGYGFYSYGNVSKLLFEVARALGCYLTTNTTITNGVLTINISFTSRQNLTEAQNTYIIGAADANIDTGASEADGANAFYGKANDLTTDGYDCIEFDETVKYPILKCSETDASVEAEKQRNIEKKANDTSFSRLALTTSQTLYKPTFLNTLPLNASSAQGEDPYYITTTALYLADVVTSDTIVGMPPAEIPQTAMRPIGKVFATIDNEPIKSADGTDGVQLSEYINIIAGRDKSFFETQYEITVPFWSGFSKNADGSNAAWNKVKLGSIIELNEKIRKYENGEWSDYTPENGTQFVVVSKDIALDKPETKLTLQNISRFAYGTYIPQTGSQILGKYVEAVMQGENIEQGSIADGETINVGDAVSMNADGKIYKTICNTEHRGQFVGVAVQVTNDFVAYQTAGVVSNGDYNFTLNEPIFVRNVYPGWFEISDPCNISDQCNISDPCNIADPCNISQYFLGNHTTDENEDLVIRLGYPISSTSFQLDYKEYEVQYREPH